MRIPNKIIIKQVVEVVEIFTDFETKNKYSILDETGKELFYADEESNILTRQILKSLSPLKIHVIDKDKKEHIVLEKEFALFKASANVSGEINGKLKQTKFMFNKEFKYLENDVEVFSFYSKFPKVWTFDVLKQGQPVGQIKKKWSGVGKEMFTDADTFMIDFGTIGNEKDKLKVIAAAFLIDLRHFDKH